MGAEGGIEDEYGPCQHREGECRRFHGGGTFFAPDQTRRQQKQNKNARCKDWAGLERLLQHTEALSTNNESRKGKSAHNNSDPSRLSQQLQPSGREEKRGQDQRRRGRSQRRPYNKHTLYIHT